MYTFVCIYEYFNLHLCKQKYIMKTLSNTRAEKIARNINAMDINFQYSDDMKVWSFWNNLSDKLREIISTLNNADIVFLTSKCDETKAKYFGLI